MSDDQAGMPFLNAQADFSIDLYKSIAETKPDASIIISPLAISAALAMMSAGANRNLQSSIRKVIAGNSLDGKKDDLLHEVFLETLNDIVKEKYGRVGEMHLANALFIQEPISTDQLGSFVQFLKEKYEAEVEGVDFSKPGDANMSIKTWLMKKTNWKIYDLYMELTRATTSVLLSAVYFKDEWKKAGFQAKNTNKQAFHVNEKTQIQVDMMHSRNGNFYYTDNAHYQMLGIKHRGILTMFIYLPKEPFGLANLEKSLVGSKMLEEFQKSLEEETSTEQQLEV